MDLTKSETKVMMIIWEGDRDMSLPEIQSLVNQRYRKDWKPQTVSTFLTRLVRKDCLNMYRQGRTFRYHPLVTREEALTEFLTETAEIWFQGDAGAMLRRAAELFGQETAEAEPSEA